MKTKKHTLQDNKLMVPGFSRLPVTMLLLMFIITFMPSCEEGVDGLPGLAYVAFTWIDDEPSYIEIANDYIPAVFFWDWYYRVDPGVYYIYYEGVQRRGSNRKSYAWELEYEVYEIAGKKGSYGWINGADGPDAYFTVELSPNGPDVYVEEVYPEKTSVQGQEGDTMVTPGKTIVVEKQDKNHQLRLTYKSVEPGRREAGK